MSGRIPLPPPTAKSAAERLRLNKERILSEWERRIERALPAVRVENHSSSPPLAEVLEGMIVELTETTPDRSRYEQPGPAVRHGHTRAQNRDYSVEEVITEYQVLRQVVGEALFSEGDAVSARENDIISDALFAACRAAAGEFTRFRDARQDGARRDLALANEGFVTAIQTNSGDANLREQILTALFERVEDYALFSLDEVGRITSWAKGAQRMKQYTAEDVLGRHFSMLYPREGRIRNEPMEHLEIAAREGRFRGEGLRQRKNGELFLADVFIVPMLKADRLAGFFKIVADVTERARVFQERDLSRARVHSLEAESELKQRFVFTLSHDLRTPLSAGRISAQLIARQSCNVERHGELAHQAIRNIGRVDKMITDLLDSSRIRAGEPLALNLEEFDVRSAVQETCDDLATVHGNRFVIDAPETLFVYWDRGALRRVIENLANNGIKYGAPTGPVTTRLRAVQDRVLLTVHNLGAPIAPSEVEALFDPFRRSSGAAAGAKQGWGLGLTLVRGIAEAHGGVVTVRSLPDEGTSFILDLPRDARTAKTHGAEATRE